MINKNKCEPHFYAGMYPYRKSIASESAHVHTGACNGFLSVASAGRDVRSLQLMLHFSDGDSLKIDYFFFLKQAPLLSCWGYLCRSGFKHLLFTHRLYRPSKIHAIFSKICSVWK